MVADGLVRILGGCRMHIHQHAARYLGQQSGIDIVSRHKTPMAEIDPLSGKL